MTLRELVLFTVVHSRLDSLFWKERKHRDLLEAGYRILREVSFRVERLRVRTSQRVQLGTETSQEILNELRRVDYGLVVLGTVDRSTSDGPQLGRAIQSVVAGVSTPAIILVTHR